MVDRQMRVSAIRTEASGQSARITRAVPVETPVALVYDGTTYAVMMATPDDLRDFALGFSLTEGVISSQAEIESLDVVEQPNGIELRMWLSADPRRKLSERRRQMTGPTGCGLCGVESLDAAIPAVSKVSSGQIATHTDIITALAGMAPAQALNMATRAVHAAAFWQRGQGLIALAEDVGRHNALDKLAGALARQTIDPADGLLLITSRVSVEMVQKAAAIGAPILVAVSAPTSLAIKTAKAANISLVAVARADGFEIFTHPERISSAPPNSKVAGDAA